MEESIGLLRLVGTGYALTTGSNLVDVAVMRNINMQFVKGALDKLKPLIIPAVTYVTGNIGAFTNALRDIGAVISESALQEVRENKLSKLKRVTSQVTRKEMRNNCMQAGVPQSEIDGITSEMFCRWKKLVPAKRDYPPHHPSCHLKAPQQLANAEVAGEAGWRVPPNCHHCSLSLGAGPMPLCSSNY